MLNLRKIVVFFVKSSKIEMEKMFFAEQQLATFVVEEYKNND